MDNLKYGSRGTDVELLQLALTRSGYYNSPYGIDGIFGADTQNAVRRFQAAFGLAADGIVGRDTKKALLPFLIGGFTTKIRSGDTFYRLAKHYGTTIAAIAAANPALNPEKLVPGTEIYIPYGFDLVPSDVRWTSKLNELVLEGLKLRYPFIGTETYGKSVMGRPLRAVSIGAGSAEAFFNASHHANEWITTPLVLKFAENYLKAYINGSSIFGRDARELFAKTRLFIAPLVNPDGVDLVNGALDETTPLWQSVKRIARQYPAVPFPSGWKANIEGTDLNLNYPAGWDTAKETKYAQGWVSPAPRDFVGAEPLSAPESRAVFDFTADHEFRLILAYHTQGEVIYWKYLDIEPPNGYDIGRALAAVSGYKLDEVPTESGFAGYKDWFILFYNRPGYTVEAGRGTNPLLLSQFGRIYNDNVGIMATALSEAGKL